MTRMPIRLALLMAVGAAVVTAFAGAAFAGDLTWESVVSKAAKHQGMVTMEDATSFSDREKQFSGFAPWIAENMKILDTDHDGMVSMDEIKVWMYMHHMSNDDMIKIWYREAQK
jgi:hypothetical protein